MRNTARWAVAASVGVHAVLLVVGIALTRRVAEPSIPVTPPIDTRVSLFTDRAPEPPGPTLTVRPPDPVPPPPDPPQPPAPAPSPPAVEDASPPAVRIVAVPAALSPELLARVREFAPSAAPRVDPDVKPAVATAPARPAARAAHGALPGGRVVYLLDASGSMGEWGKFDAARDTLAATLALQPAAVDVKVVVYAATADVATPAALAARAPAGRGDHLVGIRAALASAPDFVVWFTDADDIPTEALRAAIRRVGKPVTVVVARVGASGVAAPVAFR